MKEFGLSILKNIVTYLVVFVMAFVGLVSLTSGEFPPSMKALKGGLERMKTSYASIAKMQEMLPQLQGQMKDAQNQVSQDSTAPVAQENPMAALQSLAAAQSQNGGSGAAPDMAATMALMQGMMQQMGAVQAAQQPQHIQQLDPNLLKQLTKIEQQNNELIQRLSRIQTYLTGLHQFLGQMRPVQIAPQQPPQQQAQQVPLQQQNQNGRAPTSVPQHQRR